jgi:excisionase family DNA binding protein
MIVHRGVFLDINEARYLADVLDHLCKASQPNARLDYFARLLRNTVDKADPAIACANQSGNGRAGQPDPGHYRAYDLVPAGEASAILGCTTSNVRYLRRAGHLPAHRVGGRWLFPVASVVERAERKAARRG